MSTKVFVKVPNYSSLEFTNHTSASSQFSSRYQSAGPVQGIPKVSFVNPLLASSNTLNRELPTYSCEDQQFVTNPISAAYWWMQSPIDGFNCISNSFPKQMWPLTEPYNIESPLSWVDLMTVEQTASWIWKFAQFNGWEEADRYAQIFQENDIGGYLLNMLSLECLKSDLGITKNMHCLKIMLAIEHLNNLGWDLPDEADIAHSRSPRVNNLPQENSIWINTADMQKKTWAKYLRGSSSPAPINTPFDTISSIGWNQIVQLASESTPKNEQIHNTKAKSTRASPDNPIWYETLHKVKVRSGKSIHSPNIASIPKGSFVVINQIKGRSGRVMIRKHNGEIEKLGWVTLYNNNRQLLQMHDHKKVRN